MLSLLMAGVLVVGLQPQASWAAGLTTTDLGDSTAESLTEDSSESSPDQDFDAKIASIFKETSSGWSTNWNDEQKALYLHDYLVTHCELDKTEESTADSARDSLVDGKATPKGYANAYKLLLDKAGVSNELTGDGAANLVTIEDKSYHVNCAGDEYPNDPSDRQLFMAYCGHENFLFNNEDNSDGATEKDYYPNAYWQGVTTAIPHVGDLWAYAIELHSSAV